MSGLQFTPAEVPAADEDAQWLADAFARMVLRRMPTSCASQRVEERLRRACHAASMALSAGDVCVPLQRLIADADHGPALLADWRQDLVDSGIVATDREAAQRLPLALDADNRLYLSRQYEAEWSLAVQVQRLSSRDPRVGGAAPRSMNDGAVSADVDAAVDAAVDPSTAADAADAQTRIDWDSPARIEQLSRRLDALFPASVPASVPGSAPGVAPVRGSGPDGVDWQRVGAALALRRAFTVFSGGPGTGKTSTIVRLLVLVLEQWPQARVGLAAPTGKAASRMLQAMHDQLAVLGAAVSPALRARLDELLRDRPRTLHGLLGLRPGGGAAQWHARRRLALDVVIVDEASMIDLQMAARLFEAVADGARLILLGDRDQLAAVEAGAVFSELATAPAWSPRMRAWLARVGRCTETALGDAGGAPDHVVWLRHSRRFAQDSMIGQLAGHVRDGRADEAMALLERASAQAPGELLLVSSAGTEPGLHPDLQPDQQAWQPDELAVLRECHAGYRALLADLHDDAALQALQQFALQRVLCANRQGMRGVQGLNRFFDALVDAPRRADGWYHGRPVMVLRNDPELNLSNGDVGLALRSGTGRLAVYFDDGAGHVRRVEAHRLKACETAWAATVHKSQGSEFQDVTVVMPSTDNRGVGRELLYTAITRARQRVVLLAPHDVLRKAIGRPTHRVSGLSARLRDAGQAMQTEQNRATLSHPGAP